MNWANSIGNLVVGLVNTHSPQPGDFPSLGAYSVMRDSLERVILPGILDSPARQGKNAAGKSNNDFSSQVYQFSGIATCPQITQ
jgi:hypothetical protein